MGIMLTVTTKPRKNPVVVLERDEAGEPAAWIEFKPADTPGQAVGQRAAIAALAAGEEDAVASVAFTVALACWGAVAWAGIFEEPDEEDHGDAPAVPLPLTKANVEALLTQSRAAYLAVDTQYAVPALELIDEKKGSAPSPDGGSPGSTRPTKARARARRSGAGTTAAAATASAKPARKS